MLIAYDWLGGFYWTAAFWRLVDARNYLVGYPGPPNAFGAWLSDRCIAPYSAWETHVVMLVGLAVLAVTAIAVQWSGNATRSVQTSER
jgi:hypothetical protein